MNNIYYDTEFLEDGRTIELISIGMVADNGDELYLVNADMPIARIVKHPWLRANVLPHLPITLCNLCSDEFAHNMIDTNNPYVHHYESIGLQVSDFIKTHGGSESNLWAYYSAYDHVALAQMFGPMVNMPRHIPMYTNDLKSFSMWCGIAKLPEQNANNHRAIDDARWVRDSYNYLQSLLRVEALKQ